MSSPSDASQPLVRLAGAALVAGGVLAALLNLILSPMLPAGEGSAAVATSTAFGVRMPLAATTVALVTFGSIGLYLAHARRLRWGSLAFLVAGIGGLLSFCLEWVQSTLVRDLAFEAPEMWEQLESASRLSRYDLAFAIGAGTFAIGWLAVAIVTLRAGVLPRRGPLALLAGLVLLPVLGGLLGIWGAVAGNVVLGTGWALMGWDLRIAAGSSTSG